MWLSARRDGSGGAVTQRLSDIEVEMLARAFHRPSTAMAVLERAGLERWRQPSWTTQTPLEFWDEVNHHLRLGVLLDGRINILAAAAALYPANEVFAAVVEPAGSSPAAGPQSAGPPAGRAAPAPSVG
ncbi:effector-associated domain EAD1-containing protein, partial [Frankia sp. AiPs1]|uniref:effector-associated domain EAD1-containing protein n=1 Tax=Frankia sp. AiPs1 TaxID=573493 RepID=UPI002043C7C9